MSTVIRSVQKINMAAASDVGTVRKENEDFYYYSKMKNFFVVCDGMGGHEKGALASRMAGETLRDIFFNSTNKNEISINNKSFSVPKACENIKQDFPESALDVVAGIRLANRRIISNTLHNQNMKGMGTTVICVRFIHDHIIIGHIGDSRVYRLRKGELQLLTTDHSWLNELLEDNEIDDEEVKNFKKKNVLTRALGMSPTLKIDLQIHALEPDDLYLICSDGLYNALEDELIKSILTAYHGSLQNKVSNLVERAKNMDGSDNITAGVIHISGLQEIYPSQINEKYTIPEESEEVINYLDQKVKEIYPVRKVFKNNNSSRKLSLITALAVILLIIAFFLFRTENAQNQNNNIFESALFNQNATSTLSGAKQQITENKLGGQIVILQLNDEKYIKMLENLSGVKILDIVTTFKNNTPVYAGQFTWAIADSRENILYKKENILLEPLDNWPQDQSNGNIKNLNNNLALQTNSNQIRNDAQIFLLGDFSSDLYNSASIYLNNRFLGSLSRYKDSGFSLQSGVYDIKIVDGQKRVLKQKGSVEIKDGETIAIEF